MANRPVTLKNWSVKARASGYEAPELMKTHLSGNAYGHERFEDGKVVYTTSIVTVEGRKITTRSGSVYLLDGPPDPSYLAFLEEIGYPYNSENPIKVVESNGRN